MSIKVETTQEKQADHCTKCFHCGQLCDETSVVLEDKNFCCEGCKLVYSILQSKDLCTYYDLEKLPGITMRGKSRVNYTYLEDPAIEEKLLDFRQGNLAKVNFHLPQIHCASCIWLLENLYKLDPGITHNKVNFLKKRIFINYRTDQTSLRAIVELLDKIGYPPAVSLHDLEESKGPATDKRLYLKIGLAGFAFGNIMLLSFPEYLGLDNGVDSVFSSIFGYLNIVLALPVVVFSGRDYFLSSWVGWQQRKLTIDVPIALGIFVLFFRSVYEIMSHTGAGYMDSLAGLVFFLLIGKWFQQKIYHDISFDRTYKSYFPIAANRVVEDGTEIQVTLDQLKAADRIIIRNGELIPADGQLTQGNGRIDYSFVTGESVPVSVNPGERVFAGGRQMGPPVVVDLTKKVSQSYLTQLWNDAAFSADNQAKSGLMANKIGVIFTVAILSISILTLLYWLPKNFSTAVNAFTAVLIVACPCAVALAIPFIHGNLLRIFAKAGFYLKNTAVIERLAVSNATVFDKTGTLTYKNESGVSYEGQGLNVEETSMLRALVQPSTHPYSRAIAQYLPYAALQATPVLENWLEIPGKGLEALWQGRLVRLGSPSFVNTEKPVFNHHTGAGLKIGEKVKGYFTIHQRYRQGLKEVIRYFAHRHPTIALVSGDNESEKEKVQEFFPQTAQLHFHQSPMEKLQFIKDLQNQGKKVIMVGDGLNDAGALQQSDVGIVIADQANNFTPACDAICDAGIFAQLPDFIEVARKSKALLAGAYVLAGIYNIVGLSYAVQGALAPVVAAILMPLSSVTIVAFGMGSSYVLAKKYGLIRMTKVTPYP